MMSLVRRLALVALATAAPAAALAGCSVFLVLTGVLRAPSELAALVGIAVAFSVRLLSIRLGWRTGALSDEPGAPGRPTP